MKEIKTQNTFISNYKEDKYIRTKYILQYNNILVIELYANTVQFIEELLKNSILIQIYYKEHPYSDNKIVIDEFACIPYTIEKNSIKFIFPDNRYDNVFGERKKYLKKKHKID